MLKKPTSIEEVGLEKWLNDSQEEHNGYGYDDFVKNFKKLGKAGTAKMFGVGRDAVYRWLEVYEKEQGDASTN